jgi:hypothetical protein
MITMKLPKFIGAVALGTALLLGLGGKPALAGGNNGGGNNGGGNPAPNKTAYSVQIGSQVGSGVIGGSGILSPIGSQFFAPKVVTADAQILSTGKASIGNNELTTSSSTFGRSAVSDNYQAGGNFGGGTDVFAQFTSTPVPTHP